MTIIKKQKIRFVGNFPPPYGGVTIKNSLLLRYLEKEFDVKRIKNNSRFAQFFWFLGCAFCRCPMIIGVSSKSNKSLMITRILYLFNKRMMRKSLYFMMGGTESSRIAQNKKETKMYSNYKRIYVEIDSMKDEMVLSGLNNVFIYPNCRDIMPYIIEKHNGFRCVFFSQISKMKGADLILDLAQNHADVSFDFYGEIDKDFSEYFMSSVSKNANIKYCGIFDSKNNNVYQQLSNYDVLLFPTRWKTEGIPGILVEAKFAGIPAIVSNVSFNSKIVSNYNDGLVVEYDSVQALSDAINKLKNDISLLSKLKKNALFNSSYYCIRTYIKGIVKDLRGSE